jgi:ribonuclease HI
MPDCCWRNAEIREDTTNMYNIQAYVDGSYDPRKRLYGFGIVIYIDGAIEPLKISNKGVVPGFLEMRNVGGELHAVIILLSLCREVIGSKEIENITIHYDYTGIEKFATGEWCARKAGAILYQQAIAELMQEIPVTFHKIKAHSGDKCNDMADKLAKEALLS